MKFAGLPKFFVLPVLACALLALVACGGTSNTSLTQGNWSVTATSNATANAAAPSFVIGGNLTQSKSSVSGTMYVIDSLCFPASQPIAITGSVKDKNVTLTTASFEDQVITVTGTASDPSTITGTYKVVGGCADGDQGSVAASAMPSITGTWSGPVDAIGPSASQGITQATLSVALTQASTASTDGTFALSGTVTYTNSTCSVSGNISGGSLAGLYVANLHVDTNEQDESQGDFTFSNVLLDSATSPKNMTGDYEVLSGLCAGQEQTLTLTKQ